VGTSVSENLTGEIQLLPNVSVHREFFYMYNANDLASTHQRDRGVMDRRITLFPPTQIRDIFRADKEIVGVSHTHGLSRVLT